MASIISGFEYDIFISYRQNDNRSNWVTGFVAALQSELAATLKDPVSVYIDFNQHDGLLEHHSVDKSLNSKLKSLIFIPVISHTYCDKNCYAWQNEFLSFIKIASEDRFGKDIRLANGNVASRILPVKIHNLDNNDKALLEQELGGVVRSIEFIYREAGVNRPLRPDDNVKDNLNRTQYNNQVNKLANAIKDIIEGLKNYGTIEKIPHADKIVPINPSLLRKTTGNSRKLIIPAFLILLIIAGYLFLHRRENVPDTTDKSIAVLPLENMSKDPSQEYFSDGMMQEILNHLFMIGGLTIPSGTSSMRFKGSTLPVKEIAHELGVTYMLEGNVTVTENSVRVIVRLINGKNEQLLWTEDYNRTISAVDLLDIQSDVAQKVAEKLKVVLHPEVKKRIEARPTKNTEAYLSYLQALVLVGQGRTEGVQKMLEKAILLDPDFSDAYAALAFSTFIQGNDLYGSLSRKEVLDKTELLLKKALELDENSVMAHTYKASVGLWYKWDFDAAGREYQIVNRLNPSSSEAYLEFVQYLLIIGNFDEALRISEMSSNDYDVIGNKYVTRALAYSYSGQSEKALSTVDAYIKIFPMDNYLLFNSMRILISLEKYDRVVELYNKNLADKSIKDLKNSFLGYLSIAFYKTGKKSKSMAFVNELSSRTLNAKSGSPCYFAAAVFTAMDDKDNAMFFLQKAFSNHEVEMVWLKVDPLFSPLHSDRRYQDLLKKIGFK